MESSDDRWGVKIGIKVQLRKMLITRIITAVFEEVELGYSGWGYENIAIGVAGGLFAEIVRKADSRSPDGLILLELTGNYSNRHVIQVL